MLFILTSWIFVNESSHNWPSWRGPNGTGSSEVNLPVSFDASNNLLWSVPLSGRGHSTPIIWGNLVLFTSAVPNEVPVSEDAKKMIAEKGVEWSKPHVPDYEQSFVLWAHDRLTGTLLWNKTLKVGVPHETTHGDASWASSSCATDGEYVVVSFGSMGIFCTDMEGNAQWEIDLGDMRTRRGFGEGSSPVIHDQSVIINWDHEDQSFILALDLKSGREFWRQNRDEPTSWATPLLVESQTKAQVVVPGTGSSRGYDVVTGEELWSLSGMTVNAIPSPNSHAGLVYLMSGYRGNMLQAIRIDGAAGDLAGSDAVVWTHEADTSYVPSGLVHHGRMYFLKANKGIITCVDALTGKLIYGPQRLDGIDAVYASLVGAGDHIYVVGRNGAIAVLNDGNEFKQVATNRFDDTFDASPSISGDILLLRGHQSLYAVSKKGIEK